MRPARFATGWIRAELGQIRRCDFARPFVYSTMAITVLPVGMWTITTRSLGAGWQLGGALLWTVLLIGLAVAAQWAGCALTAWRAPQSWLLDDEQGPGAAGALLQAHHGGWRLGWVWAHPTGARIGSVLMTRVLDDCGDRDLHLTAVNQPAARFYQRHGFTCSPPGRGVGGYRMTRPGRDAEVKKGPL